VKVVIDAVGVRGHGAAAVLEEVLRQIPMVRPDWDIEVFLLSRHLREFDDPAPLPKRVHLKAQDFGDTALERLMWSYIGFPSVCRRLRGNVALCFANIGSRRPWTPQVVLVHQLLAINTAAHHTLRGLSRLRMRVLGRLILGGARASRFVVVQSRWMKEALARLCPELQAKIFVIPSPIRERVAQDGVIRESLQRVAEVCSPLIVYVAHPAQHKDHATAVRALSGIRDVFADAALVLTLDPAPRDKKSMVVVRALRRTIEGEGVADRVHLVGAIAGSEVDWLLERADLMVFPSLAESFGLPLAEAMACGCPIVAADVPYAHDVAEDCAVYFKASDSRDLAVKAISVLRDKALATRMRIKGQERAKTLFGRSSVVRLVELLEMAAAVGKSI